MLLKPLIATLLVSGASMLAVPPVRDTGEVGSRRVAVDSAEVAASVASFHAALARSDSAGAMALLAPDAMIIESGDSETRAEYQAHHLSADIALTKALPGIRGKLAVTVNGSTAWTFGTSTTKGDYKGRQINSVGAETMVLTKTPAGWRIRSIHWSSHSQRPPASD